MPMYESQGQTVGLEHNVGIPGKAANLSPYMADVLAARGSSDFVNPCPFDCTDEECDEHGRCYHRIGVSPDRKFFEREYRNEAGQLSIRVDRKKVNGKWKPELEKINNKKHVLVRVTTSYLVYENRKCPDDWLTTERAEEAADEAEDTDDGR